jgi:hypothetical protein
MAATHSSRSEDAPKYRSPKRALARAFRLSRDLWKTKADQRGKRIKALQIRVRDLAVSRDLWKTKALHLQEQLRHPLALSLGPLADDPPLVAGPDLADVACSHDTTTTDFAVPEALQPADRLDSSPQEPAQATVPQPSPAFGRSEVKKKRRR